MSGRHIMFGQLQWKFHHVVDIREWVESGELTDGHLDGSILCAIEGLMWNFDTV